MRVVAIARPNYPLGDPLDARPRACELYKQRYTICTASPTRPKSAMFTISSFAPLRLGVRSFRPVNLGRVRRTQALVLQMPLTFPQSVQICVSSVASPSSPFAPLHSFATLRQIKSASSARSAVLICLWPHRVSTCSAFFQLRGFPPAGVLLARRSPVRSTDAPVQSQA